MTTIDGTAIAQKILSDLKQKIQTLNFKPGLAVILIGADPASHLYVSLKGRACKEVGFHFEKYLFFASEPEEKILQKIQALNQRPDIHGILVQLPLPPGYNENKVIAAIDPQKDADGFHPENLKLLFENKPRILPVTAKAIMTIIDSTGVAIAGKSAIILANSTIFASPIKKLLEMANATVEVIIYKPNVPPSEYPNLKQADVIITALGKPGVINSTFIKEGALIIDVGTTRVNLGTEEKSDWKTVGDVDFESMKGKSGFITPVPGGVGPVTVTMLLENVLELARSS